MSINNQIQAIVIDEDNEFVNSIHNLLLPYSEISLKSCVTEFKQINELISSNKPDLILLDYDKIFNSPIDTMRHLNLLEVPEFKVIFFSILSITALDILRNKNVDFVNKKIESSEFRHVIERYKSEKKVVVSKNTDNKWVSLPSNTGYRFVNKDDIVLFSYSKGEQCEKGKWEVVLNSLETVKLKTNTTSTDILNHLNQNQFIQLSQKNIVNLKYLKAIESKTRKCILHEPFQDYEVLVSRAHLIEINERFEMKS